MCGDTDTGERSAPPRLSVLLTVYNGVPFVESAVQSILDQSFRDFELVIVDDGSTDATAAFLASIEDQRVRVITRQNGGTAAASNQGLHYCSGEYLARMDADDESHASRFEKQIQFLDDHPEVGLVGSYTWNLGESRTGGITPLPTEHDEIVASLRAGKHALSHPTLMMRTELLRSIGGYWDFPLVDDWDMMLRMSEVTTVANLAEPLLRYRVHRGSLNGASMKRMRFSIDFARARAIARSEKRPELSLEAFEAERDACGAVDRLRFESLSFALGNFRIAVAERNGPQPWKALPHLVLAGASRPDLVVERVARHFRK